MGPTSRTPWVGAVTALAVVATLAGTVTVVARGAAAPAAASPAERALPTTLAAAPQVAFARDRVELVEQDVTVSYGQGSGFDVDVDAGERTVVTDGSAWYEGDAGSAPGSPHDDDDADDPGPASYAFVSTRAAGPAAQDTDDGYGGDVYVRTVDGGTVRVTCDDARESHPSVSADGSQVVYATDASGQWRVVVAPVVACTPPPGSAAGTTPPAGARPVGIAGLDAAALAADRDEWPAWGPDGSTVVFQRTVGDGPSHLYVASNPWPSSTVPDCATSERATGTGTAGSGGRLESVTFTGSTLRTGAGSLGTGSHAYPRSTGVRLTYDPSSQSQPDVVSVDRCDYAVVFTTTQFQTSGSLAELALGADPLGDPVHYGGGDDGDPPICPVDVPGEPSGDEEEGCALGTIGGLEAESAVSEPSVAADDGGGTGSTVVAAIVRDPSGASVVRVAAVGSCDPDQYYYFSCGQYTVATVAGDGGDPADPELTFVPGSCATDPTNGYYLRCRYVLRYTLAAHDRVVASAPAAGPTGGASPHVTVLSVDPGTGADDSSPAYTPDGARVLVSSAVPPTGTGSGPTGEREVRVLDPGAGTVKPQPSSHDEVEPGNDFNTDDHPAASPDGSLLAFRRVADNEMLTVVDSATGRIRSVSYGATSGGSWAPDGTHLVASFAAYAGPQHWDQLSTVELGDGEPTTTPLTTHVPASTCPDGSSPAPLPLFGSAAAWSPDGHSIAVTGLLVGTTHQPAVAAGIAILTVEPAPDDVDGYVVTAIRALTGTDLTPGLDLGCLPDTSASPEPSSTPAPTPSLATVASSSDPAWSPDGSELFFSGRPVASPASSAIYAISPDGTGLRTVAEVPGELSSPTAQPVGDTAVTLAVDRPGLHVGGRATITVTAANVGTLPATPTVVVEVPGTLTVTNLPDGCTQRPATVPGITEVTCTPATLPPPGASGSSSVAYRIPVVATAAGRTDVAGAVVNPGPEAVLDDNVATVEVTVVGASPTSTTSPTSGPTSSPTTSPAPTPAPLPPNLSVTAATSSPTLWVGGRTVTVTFTVRNTGAGPADGVTLRTRYPATVTVTGDAPCLTGDGACDLPVVPPGGTTVLTAHLAAVGPAGRVDVTATVGSGAHASATVQLTVLQPWLRPSPTVARPGQVVIVHGEDFPPGSKVTLTWSPGITSSAGPYRVADDGTFDVQVLVLDGDALGSRYLRATSGTPGTLTTPRVVTPPTDGAAPDAPPCAAPSGTSSRSPAWCEVDAQALVVPPAVDSPSFLERG